MCVGPGDDDISQPFGEKRGNRPLPPVDLLDLVYQYVARAAPCTQRFADLVVEIAIGTNMVPPQELLVDKNDVIWRCILGNLG